MFRATEALAAFIHFYCRNQVGQSRINVQMQGRKVLIFHVLLAKFCSNLGDEADPFKPPFSRLHL
jgi:hypothetical protein